MFSTIVAFLLTSKTLLSPAWFVLGIIADMVSIIIISGTTKDILECKYKNINNSTGRKY